MAPAYAFHPMAREHLPMIRRWLKAPEVVRWWGDPDEQYPLVSGDLDHPDLDQFIVALTAARLHPVLRTEHLESGFWAAAAGRPRHRPVHWRTRPDRPWPWLGLHPAIRRRLARIGHSARRHRSGPGQSAGGARLHQSRLSARAR